VTDPAWRRLFLRCLLVPLVVTAPLAWLALGSDHRFNIYWHGATVLRDPAALVTENLRTIPMYLDFGNFRPLGRMLEWSVDLSAYLTVVLLHLPAQVGLRSLAAVAAAVLTAAAVLLAEAVTARDRMFASPPARPLALLPLAVGCCLAAAGGLSSTVLFGGLYFLSAAVVLAAAAWICREPRPVPLVLLAGAALAAFNEMGAVALPLATVALLIRVRVVLGLSGRDAVRRMLPAVLLWAGFLPVFLPVRFLIHRACSAGDCYRNSDVAFGPDVATALANRVTAWLPPLQWGQALRGIDRPGVTVVVAAVLVFALLAARLLAELPGLPRPDRRQAAGLAAAGLAVLVLGALLGSLNTQVQAVAANGRWGIGWRDSGLTAAGGALGLAGLLGLAGRVAVARLALAGFALAAAGSAAANHAFAAAANRTPSALVTNAIATEIVQFDDTPAGDARRCALRDRYVEVFPAGEYSRFAAGELPGTRSSVDRMTVTTDMATEQMYGRPFCRDGR
jgi:hypothetical protein